jgi:hypothetical protein
MQKFEHNLTANTSGALRPLAGASVTVTDNANGLPAALYSDNGMTPLAQPLTTDNTGYFGFYAADGKYTLTFSGPRFATFTRQILLEDPDDNPALTRQEAALPNGANKIGYGNRTVSDKLGEVVSVRDFGPLVANDASAASANLATLNSAIYELSSRGGGTLLYPAGTFHFGGDGADIPGKMIVLRSNVAHQGEGEGVTILRRAGASTLMTNAPNGAVNPSYGGGQSNIRISDMTLDGNAAFSASYPANISYWFCGDNITISRVTYLNCPGLHSIDLNGCRDVVIEDVKFKGHNAELSALFGGSNYIPEAIQLAGETNGYTIQALAPKRVKISRCYFGPSDTQGSIMAAIGNHSATAGVFTEDVTIDDLVIDSPVKLGIRPYSWKRADIGRVTFFKCPTAIAFSGAPDTALKDSFGALANYAQSGSDIKVHDCHFEDCVNYGIDVSSGHVSATSYAKWKSLSFHNLTFASGTNTACTPLYPKWVSGLTISGITMRGTFNRGMYARFCDRVRMTSFHAEGTGFEGVFVDESVETQFAGQGLTNTWAITGGTMKDIGYAGYSFSCAITGLTVSGPSMTNIGAIASGKRPGILLASGANDVLIQGVRVNGCSYGIDVTPSCSNVTVGPSYVLNAATGVVRNLATGTSTTSLPIATSSANYDPPSLADGAGATTTVTATGAALGDMAQATFSQGLQGITLTAWVSAADTVSVRFQNESGATVDLASGTVKATVTRI